MDTNGNYKAHAKYWDWGGHDRTEEDAYWLDYAAKYGTNVLSPMCALGETGAYMARRGFYVTAFDIVQEMIDEGRRRFGGIPGLHLARADATDFRFDIPPVDFCFCMDFECLHTIEDVKRALVCVHNHLRDGGGLVIEATLPPTESSHYGPVTHQPLRQVYPGLKVWKTGEGRLDAEKGRHYYAQTLHVAHDDGRVEQFEHSFYSQHYPCEAWLAALAECGFAIAHVRDRRAVPSWQSGGGFLQIEAVKDARPARHYRPAMQVQALRTPVYAHENVSLYNDVVNLQQPNDGYPDAYRFDIRADDQWVGWINVKLGYTISAHYDGQIGFMIRDAAYRNRGYMTKACLALRPFLRQCGFAHILITTDEDNRPSRRVCEKIGAVLLETVDTPTWTGIYRQGQRRTCRYEWAIEEDAPQAMDTGLRHSRIDPGTDMDYVLECHCRINYACDTAWAREKPYAQYRAQWFADTAQREGFASALRDSMADARTIADIIRSPSGEVVAYFWAPFHGEDPAFVWMEAQDLYVEEAYRAEGIASRLMAYAEAKARQAGARVIRSGTGCGNVASQRLHSRMGYRAYRIEYEKELTARENS